MLGDHKSAVLQFSGGKDSLALLYLARPHLDRITVLWGDPGATYPHVVDHVIRTCEKLGARLQIVRPPMPVHRWQEERGLPSDIVPGWHSPEMAWLEKDANRQLIQPTFSCCWAMLWQPMMEAVQRSGATLLLRGSKRSDERVGVPPGTVIGGIEHGSPLWNWSDADVFAYLKAEGAELPAHYEHVRDSLDCWLCTGHTGAHYAAGKLAYTRDHHPELWAHLAPRLRAVRKAVATEAARHDAVFAAAEELNDERY